MATILQETLVRASQNLPLTTTLFQHLVQRTLADQQQQKAYPLLEGLNSLNGLNDLNNPDSKHPYQIPPNWVIELSIEEVSISDLQKSFPNQSVNQGIVECAQARVIGQFQFLRDYYPQFEQFCRNQLGLPGNELGVNLWRFWLPFAQHLAYRCQTQPRPWIQGILGSQGTGKTTLTSILIWILAQWGYRGLSLSLDDLYKTHLERLHLRQVDPRLIWRGPPGTHDVSLGIAVLDQLRTASATDTILVPRFDKSLHQGSGDRSQPEAVQGIEIVLFEGWFVGVQPIAPEIAPQCFAQASAPIYTPADRDFALACNQRLEDYLPLWQRLDDLLVLDLTDHQLSKQWRLQAERQRRHQGKGGMDDREVEAFVDYFHCALHPQLFILPLTRSPSPASVVVKIGSGHTIDGILNLVETQENHPYRGN